MDVEQVKKYKLVGLVWIYGEMNAVRQCSGPFKEEVRLFNNWQQVLLTGILSTGTDPLVQGTSEYSGVLVRYSLVDVSRKVRVESNLFTGSSLQLQTASLIFKTLLNVRIPGTLW